jgi:hypothetical protein
VENAGRPFDSRWCVAMNFYLHAMKVGLPVDAPKLQELGRSAVLFERLASDLDHAGSEGTSHAVSRVAAPIQSFVRALSHRVGKPPTGLWSSMRADASKMRRGPTSDPTLDRSGVIRAIVSSLGTC